MMQHPYDDIQAFGLGMLAPPNAELVLDHADRCPTCAVLVAEATQGVAALEADARPRASLARPHAPAFVRSRRGRPWSTVAGLATAASLALFAWNLQLRSAMPLLPPPPVASLVHSHFVHHPLVGAPRAGAAKAIVAADGSWVFIVADRLAPKIQFDVWETRAGKPNLLGSFTANSAGEGTAFFKVPVAKPEGFALVTAGNDPATDPEALRWP